jgi:hypothetical protein
MALYQLEMDAFRYVKILHLNLQMIVGDDASLFLLREELSCAPHQRFEQSKSIKLKLSGERRRR